MSALPVPDWDADRDEVLVCVQIRKETHDVATFVFGAREPRHFRYRPGQFMTFDVPVNGTVVHRCYTLSSTPTRPDRVSITVKRVPGGPVSNWLHDNLKVGTALPVTGPMGEFTTPEAPPRKALFLSGGSGITPLMSMARAAHDLGADQDIVFVHAARSPADIIFRTELDLLARNMAAFRPAILCESAGGEPGWPGLRGRLTPQSLSLAAPDFKEREVFVCGPSPFMKAVREMLAQAGFDMARHHEESFDFAELVGELAEPAPVLAAEAPVATYKVEFTKSRRTIAVPSDRHVLQVAREEGMRLPSSCTKGLCGTCKSRLVSGQVEMKHAGGIRQREIDQGMVLICCAKPLSDLVIER